MRMLYMSEREICGRYRRSNESKQMIGILADLNGCTRYDIEEVLIKNGFKILKRSPKVPEERKKAVKVEQKKATRKTTKKTTEKKVAKAAEETKVSELTPEEFTQGTISIHEPEGRIFGETTDKTATLQRIPKAVVNALLEAMEQNERDIKKMRITMADMENMITDTENANAEIDAFLCGMGAKPVEIKEG